MIIHRYISREVLTSLGGVILVLMLIFISNRFVRFLSDAVSGEVHSDIIFDLLALKVLTYFSIMLPLSLFLGILLALGRMYRDSEIVALSASGVGNKQLLKIIVSVGLVLAVVEGAFSLYITPWAEEKGYQLQEEAQARSDMTGIRAGQFNEGASGEKIYFVERMNPLLHTMENIFVEGEQQGRKGIISSADGEQFVNKETGDRFLVLKNGYRYEGDPGQPEYRITKFREYAFRVKEREIKEMKRKRDALSTSALWGSDDLRDIGQLQWRLSLPISIVLLAALAVPLSRTTPRQGKYSKLFIGILLYVVYMNLLGMGQAAIEKGKITPFIGMWWVHLLMLGLVYYMMLEHKRSLMTLFPTQKIKNMFRFIK
ncbi:MAG: LPS export ABC transporter permease LptF [Gammaproteobacteria bacterium]|nr:LPS export ABC transporter permease LptF [Gammaproteobacteria bacterium]